ncbi:protein adenylyltransferase SelO [Planococcus salinus]|uniref:Protein nucleotidyltransferase YdiU n=1 Tax=Planococcus salinus TaxID=1848460 RepID=A0A3M8PCC7_9BACL|nr:YdiU family protein [Planococcus salinus]RNF41263.1 YdiU family protein [Planococcus salinus]
MTTNKQTAKAGWNLEQSYANLPQTLFSIIKPNPVSSPELLFFNDALAETLGLDGQELQTDEGIAVLAGNEIPEGGTALAQAYAGHQFGYFTMLGDGRALLYGEQITPRGERFDIQLKGSGRTPYSRGGDGRAALGPMLREYLISEAMHALGIPTTRSLAVVATGESIRRETAKPGAILTRVASSHLRVGTFQYMAGLRNVEELRILAEYAIERHYPEIADSPDRYLQFLRKVIEQQAELIAKWQLVGFIHGVMNTDNMAISGETIDYGPCAFMDSYDPKTVFSSIDAQGRYAYRNQPLVAGWNLARFAETLVPLLDEDQEQAIKMAEAELAAFNSLYDSQWLTGMRAKLGLYNEEPEDKALVEELLELMQKRQADYTNTFRALTIGDLNGSGLLGTDEFPEWHERWQTRLGRQHETKDDVQELMRLSNPSIIPRNHHVEAALAAAEFQKDYSVMEQLLEALSNPYAYSPEQEAYVEPPAPSNRPYQTYCGT